MASEKRLIDANGVIRNLRKELDEMEPVDFWDDALTTYKKRTIPRLIFNVITYIERQPIVDAVEVVHAEWTLVIDEYDCECIECPLCGEQFYDGDNDTFDKPWNYCPNCGAKMDGDGNETLG